MGELMTCCGLQIILFSLPEDPVSHSIFCQMAVNQKNFVCLPCVAESLNDILSPEVMRLAGVPTLGVEHACGH